MANNILLGVLSGLVNGLNAYGQARQQSSLLKQEQARQALQDKLLQLHVDQMTRQGQQQQVAPSLQPLQEELPNYPDLGDRSQIYQRIQDIQQGRYVPGQQDQPPAQAPGWLTAPAQAGAPITQARTPGTFTNPLSGLNLQNRRSAQDEAFQRAIASKILGEAPSFENPSALANAGASLAGGARLGTALTPGFRYQPEGGGPVPPTVGGIPTSFPPRQAPNTVDLGEAYKQAGRTRYEMQIAGQDQRAALAEAGRNQRAADAQQGRQTLEALRANPKMARTEAEFRARIGKAYDQQNGDPTLREAFVEQETQAWKRSSGVPGAPAASVVAAPQAPSVTRPPEWVTAAGQPDSIVRTFGLNHEGILGLYPEQQAAPAAAPNYFPGGTTSQAGVDLKGAQAKAATAHAGYWGMMKDWEPKRITGQIQHWNDQKLHWKAEETLHEFQAELSSDNANYGNQIKQYKAILDGIKAQTGKGAGRDITTNPQLRSLQQRIGQLSNQSLGLHNKSLDAKTKNDKVNQRIYWEAALDADKHLNDLVAEQQAIIHGAQATPAAAPGATLPAVPTPPGRRSMGGPPVLPAVGEDSSNPYPGTGHYTPATAKAAILFELNKREQDRIQRGEGSLSEAQRNNVSRWMRAKLKLPPPGQGGY